MKHPSVRVRAYRYLTDDVRARIRTIFQDVQSLLPFSVEDFEVVGSWARAAVDFHSDLDVNIAAGTEAKRLAVIAIAKANRQQFERAMHYLRPLWKEFGLRFNVLFQDPSVKDIPEKACYRILEDKQYHPESIVRVDKQPDGTYAPRPPKQLLRPPRFNFGAFDENGEWVLGRDPWAAEVPYWRQRYGDKFLELGSTAETAHYG